MDQEWQREQQRLREMAAKARRLADAVPTEATRLEFLRLAEQFERQLSDENAQSSA